MLGAARDQPTATLSVGVGQLEVRCGDVAGNVRACADLARQAGDQQARLLVLPEAVLTGYCREAFAGTLPGVEDLAEVLAPLSQAVVASGCTVVVCTPVQRAEARTLSSVVVRPDGSVVVAYDKQHLSGYEHDHFTPGTHGASLTVDGWSLGLSICYDGSFPEHARDSADAGDLGYLNSAAFFPGAAARQDLYYRARALENGFFVLHSALSGTCGSESFIGGSAVHDPEGRPLARLGQEPGLIVTDLSLALLRETRAAHPMHADHCATLGDRTRL